LKTEYQGLKIRQMYKNMQMKIRKYKFKSTLRTSKTSGIPLKEQT
jgi:hypothetical protein